MRFEIGQKVWIAEFHPMSPDYMTCPDCGGTGRLRVIFHDESVVSIECRNCQSGYDPPSGQIIVYRNKTGARLDTISGVEIDGSKTVWRMIDHYLVEDDHVFNTKEAAEADAVNREAAHNAEQRDRIAKKEKDTRTWAWNAIYHRREIERAKKQIEYHSAKLAVAALKAKADKAA